MGERGEGPARLDLGELTVVANEYELRLGGTRLVEQASDRAGTDHGGLVDDHDRSGGEMASTVAKVAQEPFDRRGGDVGAVLEVGRSACCERAADHLVLRGSPDLCCVTQRVGLSGSGDTDNHRDGVAVGGDCFDHRPLLVAQVVVAREPLPTASETDVDSVDGTTDQSVFESELSRRRVPRPEPIAGQLDDRGFGKESVGGSLEIDRACTADGP